MHLQSQALSIVMTLCAVSTLLSMPLQKLVNKGGGRTPKVDIERKPRDSLWIGLILKCWVCFIILRMVRLESFCNVSNTAIENVETRHETF